VAAAVAVVVPVAMVKRGETAAQRGEVRKKEPKKRKAPHDGPHPATKEEDHSDWLQSDPLDLAQILAPWLHESGRGLGQGRQTSAAVIKAINGFGFGGERD
jgi:hypothetical protein